MAHQGAARRSGSDRYRAARRRAAVGSGPARTSDDLPQPDGARTTHNNRDALSTSNRRWTSRSRPKKNSACSSSKLQQAPGRERHCQTGYRAGTAGPCATPLTPFTNRCSALPASGPPRRSTHVRVDRKDGNRCTSNGSSTPAIAPQRHESRRAGWPRPVRVRAPRVAIARRSADRRTPHTSSSTRPVGKLTLPTPAHRQIPNIQERPQSLAP